jgi:cytochrome P450
MSEDQRPVTWIESYAEAKEAFSHPALLQASYDRAKQTVFADVLVTLDGQEHLRRRRAEMALVRPDLVTRLETTLVPQAATRLIAEFAAVGEADLVDVLRVVTTEMAARVVGLDGTDSIAQLEELAGLVRRMHEGATVDWSSRTVAEIEEGVVTAREQYRERFFGPSCRRRKTLVADMTQGDGAKAERPTDLLTLLLVHAAMADMDEDTMLRESIHYLLATAQTAATVLVHAFNDIWIWLAAHPEDLERCGDPAFLQRCIHETLRRSPPTGWQLRVAAEDCTFATTGRAVQKGEVLALHLTSAGCDTAVYGEDADRFDPYRTLPPNAPSDGLAFSSGPHVCLGKRLATGGRDAAQAPGVLVAILDVLLALGARPHPTRGPGEHAGTHRHQYSGYPVIFVGGVPRAPLASPPLGAQVR